MDKQTKALVGALECAKERLEILVDAEAGTPLDVACLGKIYRALDLARPLAQERAAATRGLEALRDSAPPSMAPSTTEREKARAR